ncbi:Lanthionine synthetase C-like protein [Xylona heveae TC161]|uniref:Lanthionine synthetase C-like protein n=1 Tax=Xylona heveae (strain CBS 132557 / TC161) TaxID=1328760 RepID=A0A165A1D8_XYLHT|nr:Lanthionine synthetase C-like protein [Xylona heveae TC161]KZF19818.1 Lanthionine synthetase C-like protein [Xylona heveae TC161]
MVRYFSNDQPLSRVEPLPHLINSLARIITENSPDRAAAEPGGLFHGTLSIAYLFFRLSITHPKIDVEGRPMSHWFQEYFEQSQVIKSSIPRPGKCGIIQDYLLSLALYIASTKDEEAAQMLCEQSSVLVEDDDCSPEWLYGLAGYLYLLRLAMKSLPSDAKVQNYVQSTAEVVAEKLIRMRRPWTWHEKAYLGAAHGAIGIITQIVLTVPSFAKDVQKDLEDVLDLQLENGNWPSSLPDGGIAETAGKDRLVQFCHGAPGVIVSLLSIMKYFPELRPRIETAIQRGRECIWARGLLVKEPCLCHGISGNAMALEGRQLDHFMTFTTEEAIGRHQSSGIMTSSDSPYSLMGGEAGRAWAWAVAEGNLARTIIGYNDI